MSALFDLPAVAKHPARYSPSILEVLHRWIEPGQRVLDPFAGTGLIHTLTHAETWGVELEPEWATLHPRTIQGNALALPFADESFDVVATSPTYGNRMADHHEAKDDSRRITYRHVLGRALHPENSGQLQWGAAYRSFHERAWLEVWRVLRPGGAFILNVKDHIRKREVVSVCDWHLEACARIGFTVARLSRPEVSGMRFGENAEARIESELVAMLRKGDR